MKVNIFTDKILAAPITRYLVFFIALVAIFITDRSFGTILLDRGSIIPFLMMMLLPVSLGLRNRWNVIWIIRRACLPIGIAVCTMNIVIFLNNVDTYEATVFKTRLMYAPLALGILVSFLLTIIEPTKISGNEIKSRGIILTFLCVCIACFFSSSYLIANTPNNAGLSVYSFYDPRAIILVPIIISICFVHPKMILLNSAEKLYKSSLGMILVSTIFGVSTYVYATASDINSLGQTTATAVLGILYGAIIALTAIVAGGTLRESDQEAMFFEWHMIESYAFYVLIVMPPLSFIEILSQQGIFD
ncbi:hypothetical protein N9J28_00230 [bacterium]|jgi:hypothetical protein|nr:hypothetical protein [bacterium]MDB4155326.1 hypothetical protein [Gammaproteobacteria bacterium]